MSDESAPEAGAIGNIADLGEHQILLPEFVEQRPEGLLVGTAAAKFNAGFYGFVERVFAAGACFSGLDYAVFQDLLFGEIETTGGMRRLATDIHPFPAARQALYRGVKLSPDKAVAEYMFEPVELEVEEVVPVFAPPDPDGVAAVIDEETVKRSVPTRLDFDEFVTAMWGKSVRFGIDVALVRAAIASSEVQRLAIARMQPPTPGRDASIEEQTDALHRDNAPRILPDGRMDLRQFKNRFPQIAAGVRLLRKVPRELGKAGYDVIGARLEPELPKDFDFVSLAGPGTRIENGTDGEFIVSAIDGFISIDRQSNQISVTEKIVSREGVSMKTTGDVALAGEEFEEHGEVQERRIVEGFHMTFHAAVYGSIQSRGGRVVLKNNIAGGTAKNPGGLIRVEGRASQATLEARDGDIIVSLAEGCTIIGSRVQIERAVKCDILGEVVTIGLSEGSAIAGKQVRIKQSTARKDTETLVAMLVPDLSKFDRDVSALEKTCRETEAEMAAHEATLEAMKADPGFRQHLALAATIAKGGAKLSPQHEAKWRQAQSEFAPQIRKWRDRQKVRLEAEEALKNLRAEIAAVKDQKLHVGDGIACNIEEVWGETHVRRLAYQPDHSVVGGTQGRELAGRLHEFGAGGERLFSGRAGEFSWSLGDSAED